MIRSKDIHLYSEQEELVLTGHQKECTPTKKGRKLVFPRELSLHIDQLKATSKHRQMTLLHAINIAMPKSWVFGGNILIFL